MGPSGDRVADAFYHCQYEKSATPPSLFRTILIASSTKQGGGPGLPARLIAKLRARSGNPRGFALRPCRMRLFAIPFRGHESVTFSRISVQ
jgi:hypothetical protein